MNSFEIFLAAVAITVIGQASPGPNFVAVASAALSRGRRAACGVTLGIAAGEFVWVVAVVAGLALLFELYPSALSVIEVLGGLYMLFLAFNAAKSVISPRALDVSGKEVCLASDLRNWRSGLLIVVCNPKAALVWVATATFLYSQDLKSAAVAAFGPVGVVCSIVVYGAYALLFSTGTMMDAYRRFQRAFEGAFAVAFSAVGGALIIAGVSGA